MFGFFGAGESSESGECSRAGFPVTSLRAVGWRGGINVRGSFAGLRPLAEGREIGVSEKSSKVCSSGALEYDSSCRVESESCSMS